MKHLSPAAVLAMFLMIGCDSSKTEDSSQLFSTDSSEAIQQVRTKIPKGMAESEVRRILTELGAEVSLLESEGATNHMVVGTISNKSAQWMIGVSIVDGVVNGHSVTITRK